MKLIVFGPTGGTGRELIAQAIAAGHEVTAFTRRAIDSPAKVVVGDVLDRAAVEAALRGQDVVITALGTRPWRHVDICSGGVAAIMPAMQAAGVRRIIAMSSLGVGEPKAGWVVRLGGAIVLRKAFRDKAKMETLLADSDRDWIAVRPGFLTDAKPRGKWRVADDGTLMGGRISRADTAAFMLQQVESTEWLRRRPVVVW